MSEAENRAALTEAIEAWNKGDGEAYLGLYDPSIRHEGLTPEPLDEPGNRAFYEGMWAAFPGAQITIHDTVAEGDKLAVRFTLSGEHRGEFLGIAPTGRSFALQGHTIMRFVDGRVVERWTTGDILGVLVQLGAVPPPGG